MQPRTGRQHRFVLLSSRPGLWISLGPFSHGFTVGYMQPPLPWLNLTCTKLTYTRARRELLLYSQQIDLNIKPSMILSLTSRSHQAPDDPAQRIDRTLDDRGHRLIAGLSTSRNFDRIDAVLMVAVGHGKYLRIQHVEADSQAVPHALQSALSDLTSNQQPSVTDVRQLANDLALHQASLFEKIKCNAGKYVDRILAIAVNDPGLWWTDFDGSQQYLGLCDPVRLSQLTGVTVIDDFPARDVAAGGTGQCLDALPLWFLHSDRSNNVAAEHRLVLQLNDQSTGYWVPASDGLDSDLPSIAAIGPTPSIAFLEHLLLHVEANGATRSDKSETCSACPIEQLYADGTRNPDLIDQWNRIWLDSISEDADGIKSNEIDLKLAGVLTEPRFQSINHSDIIRSAVYWITELILAEISPARTRADQVYFATETKLTPCLINQLIQAADFDKSRVHSAPPISNSTSNYPTNAISAAVLGLLHIDQMPANVPDLTGASEQRILGRLAMGKPSNWRQLLREMADFHPPAMKLRDAV